VSLIPGFPGSACFKKSTIFDLMVPGVTAQSGTGVEAISTEVKHRAIQENINTTMLNILILK
jgi:hypothetical protein